ncbi:tetratricopeptide repeat protein [Kangiella shandongensis]|uniref:tetratricopeptide repeat protein n=1 Tax=Kangiella shandongensis TaxID=2763258 RepID=UPI001CC07820|nr:tetratricopeptide repeat protein [Kangiella shandongensis]
MNKYLYPNGSEKKCSFCEALIGVLYIIIIAAITWGIVDFIITFFTERGSFGYWLSTIIWSGWFGCVALYYSLRDALPMLAIKASKLVIYKGLVTRDKVSLDDIQYIEIECHNETGVQILITLTINSKFYAEITDNTCSIRQFSTFCRKYVPRLKIKSNYMLTPESEGTSSGSCDLDTCTEEDLFNQLDLANSVGNDELALRILHCLKEKEYFVDGFMGDIYLNSGGEFNDKKALQKYGEGYSKGDVHAAIGLGRMYFHGIEVEEDEKTALKYFQFARGYRSGNLYYYLGLYHFNGMCGIEKNIQMARYLFKKAIVYGVPEGYTGLALIERENRNFCKMFSLTLKQVKAEQLS